jgi:hypothetical protein
MGTLTATVGVVLAPPVAIPPGFWCRIKAFLAEGRTGNITLHINAGRVQKLEISEYIREM